MNKTLEINQINDFIQRGNTAIANGYMEECLKWYYLGLNKSIEIKNKIKETEISRLIYSLM